MPTVISPEPTSFDFVVGIIGCCVMGRSIAQSRPDPAIRMARRPGGNQLDPRTVLTILHNLQQQSGTARYRPGARLQRRAMPGLSLHPKEI